MAKKSNEKNFYFKTIEGDEMRIHCWTYSYSRGWGHRAEVVRYNNKYYDFTKRITYDNRTYEAFKYESMLYKIVSEFLNTKAEKMQKDFIFKQIKAIADNEAAQAEAWFNSFVKKYNALSDSTKEKIKNSDVLLNSQDEADAFINSALLLDSLN